MYAKMAENYFNWDLDPKAVCLHLVGEVNESILLETAMTPTRSPIASPVSNEQSRQHGNVFSSTPIRTTSDTYNVASANTS